MGIYVYAVYQPTEPPVFLGAWEKYEDAQRAVSGDCSDGTEPSDKKYRVVQLYYTRGEGLFRLTRERIAALS